MGRRAKTFLRFLLAFIIFCIVVISEKLIRGQFTSPLKINGLPIENVRVTGEWKPDFLWAGKAWWIEIESDKELNLILDDCSYFIPPGTHTIYSNHDSTNTDEYGGGKFWGFPDTIEVREAE